MYVKWETVGLESTSVRIVVRNTEKSPTYPSALVRQKKNFENLLHVDFISKNYNSAYPDLISLQQMNKQHTHVQV